MGRSWEEIHGIVQARRRADSALIRQMRVITDHYHGDVVIPLPDVVGEPDLPPLMPQLIHDGIETNAMRAGGPRPDLDCPARDPFDSKSVERARKRRKVYSARWYQSQLELLMMRAYRQGVAYGTWHMIVTPDYERECAKIQLRNPLSTYPELRDHDEIREPLNVGYVFGRSYDWVRRNYPGVAVDMRNARQYEDQLWDLCEWIDEDDIVLGILGPRSTVTEPVENFTGIEIQRETNRAGRVPAVAPRRLTLERIAGQLDQMVGMVDWMGRLMALDIIAAERATFPDLVAITDDGRPPELIGGEWADGRTGRINLVQARDLKQIRQDPSQMTGMMIDRLERAGRFSGGIPAVTGGEMSGSIRSGRIVDSMAAFSIDPRIQELQLVMARSLACLNDSIAAVEKGCFSGRLLVAFSGTPGDMGHVEYDPAEIFEETTQSIVEYPMPGSDLSQISVGVAQLAGAGLASKRTARRLHPNIADPEAEELLIDKERLEEAILVSLQQGAQNGTLAYIDLANILRKRAEGADLVTAVMEAQHEAQERQATQAPEPPEPAEEEEGEGVMALPPQMMAGLNAPGMAGVEGQPPEGPPAIQRPYRSLDNLDHLLETLRGA